MQKRNIAITAGVVALVGILAFGFIAPALAASTENILRSAGAVYNKQTETSRASFYSTDQIEAKGAHGYGIITDKGLDAVMVVTTHGGVLDSAAQKDASDPVYHTHYVQLAKNVSGLCGDNPEVKDITFQEPGKATIAGHVAILRNLPPSFTGTSSLTGNALTLAPGTNFANAVQFDLEPHFNESGGLSAVCVTNIQMAQHVLTAEQFTN